MRSDNAVPTSHRLQRAGSSGGGLSTIVTKLPRPLQETCAPISVPQSFLYPASLEVMTHRRIAYAKSSSITERRGVICGDRYGESSIDRRIAPAQRNEELFLSRGLSADARGDDDRSH